MIVEIAAVLAMRALESEPPPKPGPEPVEAQPWSVDWRAVANCETEDYSTIEADIKWDETSGVHEGGLQFAPETWDSFRPAHFPEAADHATPEEQVFVAELVLAAQGPGAWPNCMGGGAS